MKWRAYSVPACSPIDPVPIGDRFELGPGVWLERAPALLTEEDDWHSLLGFQDREAVLNAEIAFVAEYEADAIGSPDPNWKGKKPRAIENSINETFALSAMSLWLAKPSTLSCGPFMHFEFRGAEATLRSSGRMNTIAVSEAERENGLTLDDLHQAARIATSVKPMERGGAAWTAIWMLNSALPERRPTIRFLLLWVALEALFGPDNSGETVHQLAERIGLFLGEGQHERRDLFRLAKDLYGVRSQIVHGRVPKKFIGDNSLSMIGKTEGLIRRALTKILLDPEHLERFSSGKRDAYLRELAFR